MCVVPFRPTAPAIRPSSCGRASLSTFPACTGRLSYCVGGAGQNGDTPEAEKVRDSLAREIERKPFRLLEVHPETIRYISGGVPCGPPVAH